MSEMIERVAMAMFGAQLGSESEDETRRLWVASFRCSQRGEDQYFRMARAAIDAMREPSSDLFDAGATSLYGHPREKAEEWAKTDKYECDGQRAVEIWQAMIDAAIKEA